MKKTIYTIFGSTGDLAYRKLFPAFYNLFARGLVEKDTRFLAIGRRPWTKEQYLEKIRPWIEKFSRFPVDDARFSAFAASVDYLEMQITEEASYKRLFAYYDEWTDGLDEDGEITDIFYFAVAPSFFSFIGKQIARAKNRFDTMRVVIEKPFGEDLEHAKSIYHDLAASFGEDNVYHIDHYLGKEMIQNIMTLRQKNAIFRAAWDRRSIASVEISALEELSIGSRGGYYDQTGALKDMVQGHLFQILSTFAMEDVDRDLAGLKEARLNLLDALRPPAYPKTHVVLGQYEGYLDEKDVAPDSTTETYAAIKVYIDNDRWLGVPFYLRSGKALETRRTYVVVRFKALQDANPDLLTIEIQPQERMTLSFSLKEPGDSNRPESVHMDFHHDAMLNSQANTPEAYERLLLAAYEGNHELFTPWMQIEKIWTWFNLLRRQVEEAGQKTLLYKKGGFGPAAADRMLERDGFCWHNVEGAAQCEIDGLDDAEEETNVD